MLRKGVDPSPQDTTQASAQTRVEASRWLAHLERGLRDQEGAELREWLKGRANRTVIIEAARLWHGPDVLAVLAGLFPGDPELLKPKQRKRHPLILPLASVAAVSIITITALALMNKMPWSYFGETHAQAPGLTIGVYTTAIGEQREVKLPDNSTVTLNTGTQVNVFYSQRSRDVKVVYGEASFDVAHEAERPFNVSAGYRQFQAVGTRFNVRVLNRENVELTVAEGAVKVLYASATMADTPARRREDLTYGETTLSALETALVEPGAQTVRVLLDGELDVRLAWQRGLIIFDGDSLEEALAEVDRYTTTKFVLADDKLRSVRIGGHFRAGDVDGLLAALRKNFHIDSRRDAKGRVVLSPLVSS